MHDRIKNGDRENLTSNSSKDFLAPLSIQLNMPITTLTSDKGKILYYALFRQGKKDFSLSTIKSGGIQS